MDPTIIDRLLSDPWCVAATMIVVWASVLCGFNAVFARITNGLQSDATLAAFQSTDWERLRAQGGAYATSMLHAIVVALLGVKHVVTLLDQPADVQMNSMPSLIGVADIFTASMSTSAGALAVYPRVEHTAAAFLAYLVVDFVAMARKFPMLGGLDMLAHHAGFIACAVFSIHHRMYSLGFAWLIVGEGSTPFLCLRWFFRTLGWGDSLIAKANSALFVGLFFITRVVIYGLGVRHSLAHYDLVDAPIPIARGVLALIVLGFGLNLLWFRAIVHKALGVGRKNAGGGGKGVVPGQRAPSDGAQSAAKKKRG